MRREYLRTKIFSDTLRSNTILTLCRTLMPMTILLYLDHELLIDPIPEGDFFHFKDLKLHYIRCKRTYVSPELALWQLGCYHVKTLYVNYFNHNRFKSYCTNTKLFPFRIYRHAGCTKSIYSYDITVIYVTYFQIYYYLVQSYH